MSIHFITVRVEAPSLEDAFEATLDATDLYTDRSACNAPTRFLAAWPHINSVEEPNDYSKKPPYATLIGSPLEMELRRRVREQMKAQNILDGVLEADIVASVLALFPEQWNAK